MIGLGAMGLPMALNLARAGIAVHVPDRHRDQSEQLAAAGATVLADNAAVAAASDILGVCVRDAAQIEQTMADGVLDALRPGSIVVIHSTVAPDFCRRLASTLGEHGCYLIDAPISGLPVKARDATMTIFAGGRDEDFDRARPGFAAMGKTILHTGGIGSGQVTKIANNMVSMTTIAVLSEALQMGVDEGLDRRVLRTALESASGDSFTLRQWDFFEGEWLLRPVDDTEVMVRKDLGLAAALCAAHGADSVMVDAAITAIMRYVRSGGPAVRS